MTALATATGRLSLSIPKSSHSNVPDEKSKYINREILCVSFVRMVLIAWGTKDIVVNAAAAKPKIVTNIILLRSSNGVNK